MDEEPKITPTPILPDDYSDVATEESGAEAERRRRFQRGGRKGGRKKMSRMGPVPTPEPDMEPREGETLEEFNERFQFEKANGKKVEQKEDIPPHREVENGYEHDVPDPPEVDYQEEPGVICDKCKEKTTSRSKSPTGIRSFNVKRAKSSGGRPFGVSVGTKGKKPEKAASKKKKKPKKKSKKKAKKEEDEEESESESSSEEESDEEEEDPDAQKPVSIRLDLNLMVEIFLKAKIKGDVTITFLQ